MAMKKDLSELKSRDKDLEARQTTPPPGVAQNNHNSTSEDTPDLMSEVSFRIVTVTTELHTDH